MSVSQDDLSDGSLAEDEDLVCAPKRPRKAHILEGSDSDADNKSEQPSAKSSKYILEEVPKSVVCKTEDDAIPLPDTFPLTKHYRADVELALKSGSMTEDTTRAFLSCVAASMFTYKRYPTADDYRNVARVIIQKYPFMKSPTGTPHVSLTV